MSTQPLLINDMNKLCGNPNKVPILIKVVLAVRCVSVVIKKICRIVKLRLKFGLLLEFFKSLVSAAL